MSVPVPFSENFASGLSLVETVHGLRPLGPGQTPQAYPRTLRVDISVAPVLMRPGLRPRVPGGLAHCW